MRYFVLFYLLGWLLHNPLLALLLVAALAYASEAQFRGRYFNPQGWFAHRSELARLARRVENNPHDAAAHNDLGRLLARDGRFEQALPHLRAAVPRMAESAEPHYFLGLCLLETGKAEEGAASIRTAVELNPRYLYGEPLVRLARYHLDTGDARAAAPEAERAVTLNTSSVEGWYLLGRARSELGDRAGALEAYKAARAAYRHLPHYLRLASRGWSWRARRAGRALERMEQQSR